jgi:multimeric flavodoxin WrbA
MNPTLIILGSARGDGNTARVADHLARELPADSAHLLDLQIGPFRYDQQYPEEDDFIAFVEHRLLKYDTLVFASPVYWYSMSGSMKIFFDRISDLLKSRKDLGRRLRGKTMAVLSCAGDEEVNDSFYAAFRLSANYLGMHYGPEWHGWVTAAGVNLRRQSAN